MRLAGTLADQQDAATLADYLLTVGVAAKVDRQGDVWQLWIFEEDQFAQGKQELAAFLADREAPRYREASRAADRIRREKLDRELAARRNVVKVPQINTFSSQGRRPVTMMLFAGMAVVFALSEFGEKREVLRPLLISEYVSQGFSDATLPEIRQGQVWRLFSPMFIHGDILHFVMNSLGLLAFATQVEILRGSWRFALLVLLIQAVSSLTQYGWTGPAFGGMSGVVFGLFGYVWMKAWHEPWSGCYITTNTVFFMLMWQLLCIGGLIPSAANAAHIGGQIAGMAVGYAPTFFRSLRSRG